MTCATDKSLRMSYRIGRGEQGVLTFEPYKSQLLPLWRFRTLAIAQKSSQDLWRAFQEYDDQDDFVGMDMARKFIQMVRQQIFPRQSLSWSRSDCLSIWRILTTDLLLVRIGYDTGEAICKSRWR